MKNIVYQLTEYAKEAYKSMENKDWLLGYQQAIKDLQSLPEPHPKIVYGLPDQCKACSQPLSIRNNKQSGVSSFCNNKYCKRFNL